MKTAQEIVKESDVIIITAGAGMGVDSGLPDFRGNEGMWKAYPLLGKKRISFKKIANPNAFKYKPELAWGFYGHRYDLYKNTKPHIGFNALLELVKTKEDYFVVTSNVDGHFQKAGFDDKKIYEIHGRIRVFQCTVCNNIWIPSPDLKFDVNPETLEIKTEIPRCSSCGEIARPNIMMFNDYSFNSSINYQQKKRYDSFMRKYYNSDTKIAILEFGAGTALPTIRIMGEEMQEKISNATLIRINPREAKGPKGTISIAKGALEAIFEDIFYNDIKV
ncbi:SIR2 family NAD-dependent protein deacylase [Nitratiruptor tergarcus]|uniref:protein acetyllysine N-acetyltransferase n=1 Tax=Nitratiruptor tergarcus DSM 16512 TaxID=1069081 RepID=A0A1W1WUZ7_9BACT|nr:Sir2 family NAD-dependent protein deacetylase [Nitratiruptor tergarcus]SMC10066.1 NAD-dependent protein deacetylase, SIR2 family [Nitratiruptor tergarcus DSM 16512]